MLGVEDKDAILSFIAVTQDGYDVEGLPCSADEIVTRRLNLGLWPLYENTRNRKAISVGDTIFFYVGGLRKNRGCIVSLATVEKIEKPIKSRDDLVVSASLSSVIMLSDIRKITPVLLKPVLIEQGVVRAENSKWGAYLMGGLARTSRSVSDRLNAGSLA